MNTHAHNTHRHLDILPHISHIGKNSTKRQSSPYVVVGFGFFWLFVCVTVIFHFLSKEMSYHSIEHIDSSIA